MLKVKTELIALMTNELVEHHNGTEDGPIGPLNDESVWSMVANVALLLAYEYAAVAGVNEYERWRRRTTLPITEDVSERTWRPLLLLCGALTVVAIPHFILSVLLPLWLADLILVSVLLAGILLYACYALVRSRMLNAANNNLEDSTRVNEGLREEPSDDTRPLLNETSLNIEEEGDPLNVLVVMLERDMENDAVSAGQSAPADSRPLEMNSSQKSGEETKKEAEETDTLGVLVAAYERDIENDRRNNSL